MIVLGDNKWKEILEALGLKVSRSHLSGSLLDVRGPSKSTFSMSMSQYYEAAGVSRSSPVDDKITLPP